MKKLIQLCLFATFVSLFISCSDDKSTNPDDNPSTTSSFLNTGNWWKYNVYEIDEAGNIMGDPTETYTDRIVGKTNIEGKDAFILVEEKDSDLDSNYIYINSEGVFALSSQNENEEPSGWLKSIDFKNANWDVFKYNVDEEEDGVTTKGVYGLKGQKIESTQVTYKGKAYTVQNYMNVLYSDVTVTYTDENGELVTEKNISNDTTGVSLIPELGIYSTSQNEIIVDNGVITKKKKKAVLVDHLVK